MEAVQTDIKRLTLKEREELEISVASAQKCQPGRQGNPITIKTNFVEVKKMPSGMVYHYDIDISPTVPPRLNRYNSLMSMHVFGDLDGASMACSPTFKPH